RRAARFGTARRRRRRPHAAAHAPRRGQFARGGTARCEPRPCADQAPGGGRMKTAREMQMSVRNAGLSLALVVAPDAVLFDGNGKKIGSHYAGPHWEAADGSRIVAAVKARADAPSAGAIPSLLLGAKSVGGEGAFSKVTSIQRVATVGGIAPAGGCFQAGNRAYIPYIADYYFFTAR